MYTYKKPFHMDDGRIKDADGKEVRLWGVNYYAPFNHNYANIEEMGVDHYRAVDRDVEDFKRMGVQLVRMHAFDREITDLDGNIIENDHLRVMDYLIQKLFENGIYVMLTTLVWYNTVENQLFTARNYAYWDVGQSPAFGFSNMYPKHSMIWHEKAIACEERYITQLFERKNSFSGKMLSEYDNVVVIEIINEPDYPSLDVIKRLKQDKQKLEKNPIGRVELKLLDLYKDYLSSNNLNETDDTAEDFCIGLIDAYIKRMFGLVERHFGNTVIKTHIHYGVEQKKMHDCLKAAPVDALSVTVYAPCYFDSAHNDSLNRMKEIRSIGEHYRKHIDFKKGQVAYEFNSPTTLQGYPLAALGYMMAATGVQIAAYFTYTPVDVAPYNPGWVVHFLNLKHTPDKAGAFTAAGEIFRNTPYGSAIPKSDELWKDSYFEIDAKKDIAKYIDDNILIYSADCEDELANIPERIIGVGNSKLVRHEGNGCYFISRVKEDVLTLTVLPNQFIVNDPFRGKSFRFMANRYIDTNREWVVSRLKEKGTPMKLMYPGFPKFKVECQKEGNLIDIEVKNGEFLADPGNYIITKI